MDNETKKLLKDVIDDMSCEEIREILVSNIKNGDIKLLGYDYGYEGRTVEYHEVTVSVALRCMW